MKFNKVIAIPAIALTAGLSLAACGSSSSTGSSSSSGGFVGGTGNASACTDYSSAVTDSANNDGGVSMDADIAQAVNDSTDPQMSSDLAAWQADEGADGQAYINDIKDLNWDCDAYNGSTTPRASNN